MIDLVTRPPAPRDIPQLPAIERLAFQSIADLSSLADSAVISEAGHTRHQAARQAPPGTVFSMRGFRPARGF